MTPEIKLWLDVKELDSTGDLATHVKQSEAFLLFLTAGYFSSNFCRQELAAAHGEEKKIIIIREADSTHGGGDPVKAGRLKTEIEEQRKEMDEQQRKEMDETKRNQMYTIDQAQLAAMTTVVNLVEQDDCYPWTRSDIFQEEVLTSVVKDIVQHMQEKVPPSPSNRSNRLPSQRSGDEASSYKLPRPSLRSGEPKSKVKLDCELWLYVPPAYKSPGGPTNVFEQLRSAFESVDKNVRVTSKPASKRADKPSATPGDVANPVTVLLFCDPPEFFFDTPELVEELKRCFPKEDLKGHVQHHSRILLYSLENSFGKYMEAYRDAGEQVRELEKAPFVPMWGMWPQDPQLQKLAAYEEVRNIVAILAKRAAGGMGQLEKLKSSMRLDGHLTRRHLSGSSVAIAPEQ